MKKHNYSAGPCILPQEVFEEASKAILNLLLTKSALKQDISEDTQHAFKNFKDHWRLIIICIGLFLKFSI